MQSIHGKTGVEVLLTVCKNTNELASAKADVIHSGSDSNILYSNKAALGCGTIDSVPIDSFNQLADGAIKSSEYIANVKAAAAQ